MMHFRKIYTQNTESAIFGCASTKKESRGKTGWGIGRWFVALVDFSDLAQSSSMTFTNGDTVHNFCSIVYRIVLGRMKKGF